MTRHKVVTYNVLSSHLAGADYFVYCDPKNLDAGTRLARVQAKLNEQIKQRAIICLQEVSTLWAGSLHTHFASHNYHFIFSQYSAKFSGYMGVGIAFPLDTYNLLTTDITRVADTGLFVNPEFEEGDRPPAPKLTFMERFWKTLKWVLFGNPPLVPETWEKSSRYRKNTMISLRLQPKESNARFCVSTYHMPCAFRLPKVMLCHASLAVQCAQTFAGSDPLIVTGDWNFIPNSTPYRLITRGAIEPSHPEYVKYTPPNPTSDDETSIPRVPWSCELREPMRSACAVHLSREPAFTNNAQPLRESKPFVETLDFVFVSEQWQVKDVDPLPMSKDVAKSGVFPSETEPSDHVLVGVTLAL
eukprot:c11114_g1_i1.p1 GENE.c11114_g1_i1~~c11114_g1_i1.p1  ORF type:complete len:369 (+),score=77.45 c11114_g1_i1:35-1108(+)